MKFPKTSVQSASANIGNLEGSLLPFWYQSRWVLNCLQYRKFAIGLSIFAAIALFAIILEKIFGLPATLLVLIGGIGLRLLVETRNVSGIKAATLSSSNFATTTILRLGIVLLGFRLSFEQISAMGPGPVLLSVVIVVFTLALGYFLGRKLGLSGDFAIIASGATAICGASAALALTAIFPKSEERDCQVVLVILIVTLLSSFAMISYPIIADSVGLNATQAGILFGATIHDVAQVVGAGLLFGETALETSVYSKMLRVTLLAPAVVVIACLAKYLGSKPAMAARDNNNLMSRFHNLMPPNFVVAFLAIIVLSSVFSIPAFIVESAIFVAKIALVFALTALAFKLDVSQIAKINMAPFLLIFSNTVFVFVLSFIAVWFLF